VVYVTLRLRVKYLIFILGKRGSSVKANTNSGRGRDRITYACPKCNVAESGKEIVILDYSWTLVENSAGPGSSNALKRKRLARDANRAENDYSAPCVAKRQNQNQSLR
jgi:hypothetical protein